MIAKTNSARCNQKRKNDSYIIFKLLELQVIKVMHWDTFLRQFSKRKWREISPGKASPISLDTWRLLGSRVAVLLQCAASPHSSQLWLLPSLPSFSSFWHSCYLLRLWLFAETKKSCIIWAHALHLSLESFKAINWLILYITSPQNHKVQQIFQFLLYNLFNFSLFIIFHTYITLSTPKLNALLSQNVSSSVLIFIVGAMASS